jgi:isoamylase
VIGRGRSYPPGSRISRDGTNFSLYSRAATRVELLLFDHEDDAIPARIIDLDAASHRSYHYWHVFVPGIKAGQWYGYRVHGPLDPANGQRFDAGRVLLDPYARACSGQPPVP